MYKKELNLQKAIMVDCGKCGWIAEHYESKKGVLPSGIYFDSGVPKGYPDLTIYLGNGIICFAELKVKGNKCSIEQNNFRIWAIAQGYLCETIYNLEEWESYKSKIKVKYVNKK